MYRQYVYWILYASSYAPLLGILALRSIACIWLVGVLVGIVAASLAALKATIASTRRMNHVQFNVESYRSRHSDVAGYIATYIIPFSLINTFRWEDWISAGLLFLVIGYVYVSSDMICINPVLSLFGFRIFRVVEQQGIEFMLVTRSRSVPSTVRAHRMSDGVYLEHE